MSPQLNRTRELLKAEDVGGLTSAYAEYLAAGLRVASASSLRDGEENSK